MKKAFIAIMLGLACACAGGCALVNTAISAGIAYGLYEATR